ncbi:hypothetical protein ABK040_008494 [Willaertia magna]
MSQSYSFDSSFQSQGTNFLLGQGKSKTPSTPTGKRNVAQLNEFMNTLRSRTPNNTSNFRPNSGSSSRPSSHDASSTVTNRNNLLTTPTKVKQSQPVTNNMVYNTQQVSSQNSGFVNNCIIDSQHHSSTGCITPNLTQGSCNNTSSSLDVISLLRGNNSTTNSMVEREWLNTKLSTLEERILNIERIQLRIHEEFSLWTKGTNTKLDHIDNLLEQQGKVFEEATLLIHEKMSCELEKLSNKLRDSMHSMEHKTLSNVKDNNLVLEQCYKEIQELRKEHNCHYQVKQSPVQFPLSKHKESIQQSFSQKSSQRTTERNNINDILYFSNTPKSPVFFQSRSQFNLSPNVTNSQTKKRKRDQLQNFLTSKISKETKKEPQCDDLWFSDL